MSSVQQGDVLKLTVHLDTKAPSLPDKIGSIASCMTFRLHNCGCMKNSPKYFRFIENNISTLKKENLHNENVAINILKEKELCT